MSPSAAQFSYWDQAEEPTPLSQERVNILVVDDLPEKLLAYEAILEEMGQNLITVRSGEEALKMVLKEEFAVILLDVNMPGMDGFETASMIRQRKKSSHTPIIFLTAFTDEIRMAQGYASGAVDYLPTPVVPEILKAKVRVFIELSQMRRQAALQAEEHALRTVAEEAARRSDFLVNASEALSYSTQQADIILILARLCIPYLADASFVWIEEEGSAGELHRVWVQSNGMFENELNRNSLPGGLEKGLRQAVENRRPFAMAEGFHDPQFPLIKSALLVPILMQNQPTAVLVLARFRKMPYQSSEVDLAMELASRASVALDKAILMCRIQEGDRRKDEFLAMLAHELRNPLAPIHNALQVMQRTPERIGEAQEIIERQLNHMIHLVDDLMDVSRITQGKIELRAEPVTLKAVLEQAMETSQPLVQKRKHTITVQLPEKDIWLKADISRLSQIFSNLINNAAKYTDEGGNITISAMRKGSEVRVEVRDDGIGIPNELLRNVFELFSQVDSSMERSQGGLGIGLTLVKSLVEMHGGTIAAQSEGLGKGSSFIVTFPTMASPEMLVKDAVTQEKPEHRLRVLIVDDNAESAQTLGWMVELDGHETRLAYDGKEALVAVQDYRPDVVLLDIGLPGMNGYETCKAMRQLPVLHNTLFIAQTGWDQKEHYMRSKEAGFHHHLVKPVKAEMLQNCFRSAKPPHP